MSTRFSLNTYSKHLIQLVSALGAISVLKREVSSRCLYGYTYLRLGGGICSCFSQRCVGVGLLRRQSKRGSRGNEQSVSLPALSTLSCHTSCCSYLSVRCFPPRQIKHNSHLSTLHIFKIKTSVLKIVIPPNLLLPNYQK